MRIGPVVGVCALLALVGCSGGAFSGLDQANTSGGGAGARLTGSVHGGQQAIVGAHVYLFAANTTGYGGAGIAASASNASVSLLTSGAGRTLDSSGGATNGDYYVTTDASGGFSITGDYTCAAGLQVYLYALGGNPGSGTNLAAGLMAVLGNCPAAGTFSSSLFVSVNEVSTVAAAYAMAGFATDATHVSSSGTALAQTGIANAFATVANLETLSTGVAQTQSQTFGSDDPNTLNTIADILAACVNSTGAVTGPTNPTPCYTLFNNAMSGGLTGVAPSETATAAINLAHFPGVNHGSAGSSTTALFGLVGGSAPFQPTLSFAPLSFAIGITYTFGGVPLGIAIDGSGNVWITETALSGVVELSNSGSDLSPSLPRGYTGGGITNPSQIAIDQSGNAWVTNPNNNSVTEISSAGTFLSGANGYNAGGLSSPRGIAIDGFGNAWVANAGNDSVTELSSSGSPVSGSPYTGGGLSQPVGIAIDGSENKWISNSTGNSVTELASSGSPIAGSPYTGGGLNGPFGIAIDNSGSVWVTSYADNRLTKLSNSGSILLGNTAVNYPAGLAIDGAGNAWLATTSGGFSCCSFFLELSNSGSFATEGYSETGAGMAVDGSDNVWNLYQNGVIEYVGAGTPVVTPLSVGVQNNTLGTRP